MHMYILYDKVRLMQQAVDAFLAKTPSDRRGDPPRTWLLGLGLANLLCGVSTVHITSDLRTYS